MKQKYLFAVLIALLPLLADAQLGNILKKVKDKTKQRADHKVDEQIDKTLDNVEGKKKPAAGSSGNTPSTDEEEQTAEEPALKHFSKFDFIPGDSVLYYDNFEGEAIAELPTGWNTNGTGEVITLDKYPGNWLQLHKGFNYLSSNQKVFGENFTVEFDVILQLKSNGWMYPEISLVLFTTKEEPNGDNKFLKGYERYASIDATLNPGEYGNSKIRLNSFLEGKTWFHGEPKAYEAMEKSYGRPMHIAIQVQKERFRMWINESKVFDVPKAIPADNIMNQLMFKVSHTNYAENQYAVYISNAKVATGKPDTRHKLIEEGKFSTTGILFDFQSAVIKPESYAVVKEIAGVLKENGGVKISVLGHTSSDGDDNANMELSKKRAAAVKDLLVSEFNIDATRIETEGKGETQPVADNKTKEGKAQNRRVEFVKR